jgi:hypothetical protein
MGHMTETPEHTETPENQVPTTTSTEPRAVEPQLAWRRDGADRPNRVYRIAAGVLAVAAGVFIVAVIFWSGFALGAHAGGHHGHGGGSWHHSAMMHHGPQMGQWQLPGGGGDHQHGA